MFSKCFVINCNIGPKVFLHNYKQLFVKELLPTLNVVLYRYSLELWCCLVGDLFIRDEAIQGNLYSRNYVHPCDIHVIMYTKGVPSGSVSTYLRSGKRLAKPADCTDEM